MNQACLETAALMKAQNTFLFSMTSGLLDSGGFIYGFFQENQSYFLMIFQISQVWIQRFQWIWSMSIVSLISFVVMTLFYSLSRASFTAWTLFSSQRDFSCACNWYFWDLSSAFSTNWRMRWLIFSGRMQNSFPISQGFLLSMYRICNIAFTFPRKFFDSWVLGFAILRILIIWKSFFISSGIYGASIGS